jgi:predicted permease
VLFDELTPAVRTIAGVEHVTPILVTPFSGTGGWDGHFIIEGQSAAEAATNPYINLEVAGPEYFATFETPMLSGRGFTAADREGAPRVVVVNQAVAQRFWPGEQPTGKRVALNNPTDPDAWLTVVGVAGGTRYRALREPAPTVYFPFAQSPWAATMMAVRTADAAVAVIPAARRAITDAAPDVLVWRAETMERLVARQLTQPRTGALLLAAFSAIALLLAAIGIYGVVMLAVRHRTTELGVRLALGALPAQVRRLVLRDALLMIATGAAFGLAGAIAGTRVLGSLLFDVSPTDPLTLAAVCFALLGVGLAAAYAPAAHATRIDPAAALRSD